MTLSNNFEHTLSEQTPPHLENGNRNDFSLSLGKANLIGIPFFLISAAIVVLLFSAIWDWATLMNSLLIVLKPQNFIITIVFGTVVHEGLHALGWKVFGQQPWSVFTFGINWKTVTPYAHCQVPLKASAYRIGTALPGIVLGIFPSINGILFHDGVVTLFGAFFLGAACGDFLCLWILRSVPADTLVIDHPTRAGCLVLESSDLLR
jgi:hypothetical protein